MLSRAELKRLHGLARAKERARTGRFLAEGVRLAEELLDSGTVLHRVCTAPSLEDTPRGRALLERLRTIAGVTAVTDAQLGEIAATETPQGVVIEAEIPRTSLDALQLHARDVIVLLDAVQDPGNFGTIVRSADAFGAAAVVALPGTVDPWNPKAVRAAMGSSLRVPVIESDLATVRAFLQSSGCMTFGADASGDDAASVATSRPVAVVLGNEGAGLGDDVRALCHRLVAIPMRGRAESLNVGVAAGILLYLLSRET